MTPWQDRARREAALAAGVSDFVGMPLKTTELLDRVALWLALGARLREQQQASAAAERWRYDFLAVKDCLQVLTAARPLAIAVDLILQPLVLLLGARRAVVFPWDSSRDSLGPALGHGVMVETPPLAALRISRLTATLLAAQRPWEIQDLDAPSVRGPSNRAARELGWRGLAAQGLEARGQRVGLLYVGWTDAHRLDDRERQLITLAGHALALSLMLEGSTGGPAR